MAAALEVLNDEDATQEEVDAALAALRDAVAGHTLVGAESGDDSGGSSPVIIVAVVAVLAAAGVVVLVLQKKRHNT